jgi:hypothetical protein
MMDDSILTRQLHFFLSVVAPTDKPGGIPGLAMNSQDLGVSVRSQALTLEDESATNARTHRLSTSICGHRERPSTTARP